jgi:hypothetical protein
MELSSKKEVVIDICSGILTLDCEKPDLITNITSGKEKHKYSQGHQFVIDREEIKGVDDLPIKVFKF